MYRYSCLLIILISLSCSAYLQAQISFHSDKRISTENFSSGVAVVVTDLNGDGIDDIARLRNGRLLELAFQGHPDYNFHETLPLMANGQAQWTLMAGDVNNDSRMDLVSGGNNDGIKLLVGEQFALDQYTPNTLSVPTFFAQSSNFVDVNNDGFLDAFVCNDDGISRLFINDGLGNLLPTLNIDFSTDPPSDNSGNYGSIWTDFDSDGDIDLYVAKCRQGVNNPEDPRRINQLFLNDGMGNYTESADSFNLAIGDQSWTADFGDFDNDGDFDCFITNHDAASLLLENIDNAYFEDITSTSGIVVDGAAIQGVFRDMNNDGLLDIVVAGSESYIFLNNGDKTFETLHNPLNNTAFHSCGIGDLNDDGFLDIYGIYQTLFNGPNSNRPDIPWLNDGNENNYLKVYLKGVVSNMNGVGARIEIFGPWGVQTREVHAGESYGITNSLIMHFGLGQATKVDSMRISWPSGVVDLYEDTPVNTTLVANEDQCLATVLENGYEKPVALCTGEPVTLVAPAGYEAYLWSNGEDNDSIEVMNPGIYHVSLTDGAGCVWITKPIQVINNPDQELFQLEVIGDTLNCDGSSVTLLAPDADSYLWNTNDTSQSIEVTQSGAYSVMIPGLCMSRNSEPTGITFIIPDPPLMVRGDTLLDPGIASLTAIGEDLYWFADEFGGLPLGQGTKFNVEIDTTTEFWVENRTDVSGAVHGIGMPDHPGGSQYNGDQFNGMLVFDVWKDATLESVTVITEFEGMRRLVLLDEEDEVVMSKDFEIDSGMTVLPLEWPLVPGTNYKLGTDGSVNNDAFGVNSPRLFRSEEDVDYPYEIENLLTIRESNFGLDFYYYFFDWQIRLPDLTCVSPRFLVKAVLDKGSAIYDPSIAEALRLYPNPSHGSLIVELVDGLPAESMKVQLVSSLGQILFDKHVTGARESMEFADLSGGLYIVRIWKENRFADFKWVVQE